MQQKRPWQRHWFIARSSNSFKSAIAINILKKQMKKSAICDEKSDKESATFAQVLYIQGV